MFETEFFRNSVPRISLKEKVILIYTLRYTIHYNKMIMCVLASVTSQLSRTKINILPLLSGTFERRAFIVPLTIQPTAFFSEWPLIVLGDQKMQRSEEILSSVELKLINNVYCQKH